MSDDINRRIALLEKQLLHGNGRESFKDRLMRVEIILDEFKAEQKERRQFMRQMRLTVFAQAVAFISAVVVGLFFIYY